MAAPYPLWLIAFFGIPLVATWLFAYRHLWRYRKAFVLIGLLCAIPGGLWDLYAVGTGIWYWPVSCCALPRLYTVPLEELFFCFLGGAYIASLTIIVRDIVRTHHHLKRTGKR